MVVRCDSSAARGIAARQGLDRLRHFDVRHLWLQQQVAHGRVKVESVSTQDNLADLVTKRLDETKMRWHLEEMRFETDSKGSTRHRQL